MNKEPQKKSVRTLRVGEQVSPFLSQTQIIRSLGEALAWLEKELEWGSPLAELRHLTGRIGELYAAKLTRGQMAPEVNQHGYDVVAPDGEHISVKTITSSNRVPFNPRTMHMVDRVMVFQIRANNDDGVTIETLLDIRRPEFEQHLRYLANGDIDYPVRPGREPSRPLDDQTIAAEAEYDAWLIRQYESATIKIWREGRPIAVVLPKLRTIAARVGVDLRNGNGGLKNTQQLGASVIDAIKILKL